MDFLVSSEWSCEQLSDREHLLDTNLTLLGLFWVRYGVFWGLSMNLTPHCICAVLINSQNSVSPKYSNLFYFILPTRADDGTNSPMIYSAIIAGLKIVKLQNHN